MSTDPKPKTTEAAIATQTLYAEHGAMLDNYARRLMSGSNGSGTRTFDEKDVAQETWARTFKHFGNGKTVDYPQGFLRTTARNVAFSMFKRSRGRIETDEIPNMDVFPGTHESSPEQQAILGQQVSILRELVNQLPKDYMEPFLLVRVAGKSHDEVAKMLGISLNAVKSRVSRACQMLIKVCEERGIELDRFYKR